jgi:hypothetical protein
MVTVRVTVNECAHRRHTVRTHRMHLVNQVDLRSMRSMRSMRGGIIFRNRGPSLKVHHGQCLHRRAENEPTTQRMHRMHRATVTVTVTDCLFSK